MNLIENTMYQDDIMKIITHPLPWNKLQNKALLISGATGLVGSFLIDVIMLLNREQGLNCKVYSLGRNEDKAKSRFSYCYESSLFQFISYDINLPFVRNDIGSVDYVLHLASNTHPVAYATDPIGTITTNIIGTQNMLELLVLIMHHAVFSLPQMKSMVKIEGILRNLKKNIVVILIVTRLEQVILRVKDAVKLYVRLI